VHHMPSVDLSCSSTYSRLLLPNLRRSCTVVARLWDQLLLVLQVMPMTSIILLIGRSRKLRNESA
jgi:hypothetical protein